MSVSERFAIKTFVAPTDAKGNNKTGATTRSAPHFKQPSSYGFDLEDISSADAGRAESGIMIKSKIRTIPKISLEWQTLTTEELHNLLPIFENEYMKVTYFNPVRNAYQTNVFYVGNRNVAMYNKYMELWTGLSVNLIGVEGWK